MDCFKNASNQQIFTCTETHIYFDEKEKVWRKFEDDSVFELLTNPPKPKGE